MNIPTTKMYLLKDGTSPVAGFEDTGREYTEKWRNRKVNIAETTNAFEKL